MLDLIPMSQHSLFGLFAAILPLVATIFYIRSILQGSTKINLAGNVIYIVSTLMIIASSLALGVTSAIILAFGYLACQLTITAVSLRKGYFAFTRFDYLCLTLSFFGLLLWINLNNPLYALVINVLVDALGSFAVLKKLYIHPRTEAPFPWFLAFTAGVINLLAIPAFNLENTLYTYYSIVSSILIFLLALRKKSGIAV
jgi:hypothetical protein